MIFDSYSLGVMFFFGFFILLIGTMIYLTFSDAGKGALFGGRVIYTNPRQVVVSYMLQKIKVSVHTLESSSNPHEKVVCLEINMFGLGSWRYMPISMTKQQTNQLIEMLEEALQKKGNR
jgi:hypothetical protein